MLGLQDKIGKKHIGEFSSHNFSDFYPKNLLSNIGMEARNVCGNISAILNETW